MFEEKRDLTGNITEAEAPQEVVSWYTPKAKEGTEVVSYYVQSCPLPEKARQPEPAPAKKKSRRRLWIFLACFAVLLIVVAAAVIVGVVNSNKETPHGEDGDASSIIHLGGQVETTIPVVKAHEDLRLRLEENMGEDMTIQEVYATVNPAVITVVANKSTGSSVGTGVIMTEDGYFVTNAHVINGARSCWIILASGLTYDARLVGYDEEMDLAVLKAVNAQGLPAAVFASSDNAVVGDTVYAIGNPLGIELRGTLTNGIISAVNRDVEMDGRMMTLLQTNAALNNGNSGGPLINTAGQVIGINVMKMTNSGWELDATVEGLGFALPMSDMVFVVNDILAHGYFRGIPTIGIMVVTMTNTDGSTFVLVDSVTKGSGAEKAGIEAGDIIIAADGQEVLENNDLLAVRRNHSVDETVVLTVRRGEETLEVQVVLQSDRG